MTGAREALVRVRLLPDGSLEYEGYGTGLRRCHPDDLGKGIVTLLADPNLPPLESTGGAPSLVDLYASVLLPPHLRPLARPSASMLRDFIAQARSMFQSQADGSWARDQEAYGRPPPGYPPGPPPPPPGYPPSGQPYHPYHGGSGSRDPAAPPRKTPQRRGRAVLDLSQEIPVGPQRSRRPP